MESYIGQTEDKIIPKSFDFGSFLKYFCDGLFLIIEGVHFVFGVLD